MRYQGSPTSIFPLLARWRSSLPQGRPPIVADALRIEAQRCFRLARGIASSGPYLIELALPADAMA